jgi:uncharacterized protein (TIGR00369 family)
VEPTNPAYKEFVKSQFSGAAFIQHLAIELADFGPGWCETRIAVRPEHLQQDGFVHAGVIATLADHSSGMAAGTLCTEGRKVLTVEFKINLMRPGTGAALTCRAEVVRPGRTLSVTDARVFGGDGKAIALMTATMALVE